MPCFIHSTDTNTIDAKPVQMIKNTVKQKTSDNTGASTIELLLLKLNLKVGRTSANCIKLLCFGQKTS